MLDDVWLMDFDAEPPIIPGALDLLGLIIVGGVDLQGLDRRVGRDEKDGVSHGGQAARRFPAARKRQEGPVGFRIL
jgi:hypothetical protein